MVRQSPQGKDNSSVWLALPMTHEQPRFTRSAGSWALAPSSILRAARVKGLDEQIASYLSKLGCVQVCGNLERCTTACGPEIAGTAGSVPHVLSLLCAPGRRHLSQPDLRTDGRAETRSGVCQQIRAAWSLTGGEPRSVHGKPAMTRRPDPLRVATDFLQERLAEGPVLVSELEAAAERQGCSVTRLCP
jgi:hypothetical protein